MHRAHPGQAGIQRDQQVERFFLPDLTDDHPARPHPERLLHQPTEPDLAVPLQIWLPGLHGDHVGQVRPELEDLLAGDHPLPGRDGIDQGVQQGGLARLRTAGDDDVESGGDGRLQEQRGVRGDGAQRDQILQRVRGDDELADVQAEVLPGDVRDHRMQPAAIWQQCVDKW